MWSVLVIDKKRSEDVENVCVLWNCKVVCALNKRTVLLSWPYFEGEPIRDYPFLYNGACEPEFNEDVGIHTQE